MTGVALRRTPGRTAVLLLCSAGMFLVLLDVTAVNVALPRISSSLDTGIAGLQWVVDGYAVPLAALLLAAGGLADRWGPGRLFATGLAGFGGASLVCGLAPGTAVLVAGRALQGLGAAMLLPASMAVVLRAFPDRAEQARALGVWAGVSSLALPAGPVVGGLLTQTSGWRSVFLVNVPVVLAALAVLRRVVGRELWAASGPAGRADLPGAGLATLGLGAAVLAVIAAGHGSDLTATVAGVAALAATAGFVAAERSSTSPMLPLRMLRHRTFAGATAVSLLMNFVGIGSILLLTFFLQGVRGMSPLPAGLVLLPLFAPLAALAPLTGRLVARVGPGPPMAAGLLLGAAGSSALVTVDRSTGWSGLLPALLGLGTGMGLLTAAVVAAAVGALPVADAGVASGINNAARQSGGALGIAAYGAITGAPAHTTAFLSGVHRAGALGAATWLVALALTAVLVRAAGPRISWPAGARRAVPGRGRPDARR
jgi:DHA2 family methylenomycin A resistance protein-like MFS transporter